MSKIEYISIIDKESFYYDISLTTETQREEITLAAYQDQILNSLFASIIKESFSQSLNFSIKEYSIIIQNRIIAEIGKIIDLTDSLFLLKDLLDDVKYANHQIQLLLLTEFGFFENEKVNSLSTENQNDLASLILNRSKENTKKYRANYYNMKKSRESKFTVKTKENLERANELLEEKGIKSINK